MKDDGESKSRADRANRRNVLKLIGGGTVAGMSAQSSIGSVSASDGERNDTELRVLNWNMHVGIGMDGVYNLRRTADLIDRTDADLIALQEVDKHLTSRSNCDDQPRRLAEMLNMHVDYAANITEFESDCEQQSRYGTAILTKREHPILDTEHYELPTPQIEEEAANEPRGLQEATVQVAGRQLKFYTTHLDHLFEERRMAQVEAILAATDGVDEPQILTGDFNTDPDSDPITTVTDEYVDAFAAAGSGDADTYPAIYTDAEPERRIDYVFSSEDVLIEDAGIAEKTLVSDHLPTIADLRIP